MVRSRDGQRDDVLLPQGPVRADRQEAAHHLRGIPGPGEILQFADWYKIPFPKDIHILAMQIEDSYQFNESLSPTIQYSLPEFEDKARSILDHWLND